MDDIDLYIDGADFYSGSTSECLQNGWCDFRKLGTTLAQQYFGTAVSVGRIYYVDTPIRPDAEASYEEIRRKQQWIHSLRQVVNPVMIERSSNIWHKNAQRKDGRGALVIGAEQSHESRIELGVRANYNDVVLAIPPDSTFERSDGFHFHFTHSELEVARLDDEIATPAEVYRWAKYEKSKSDRDLVDSYCEDLQTRMRGLFDGHRRSSTPGAFSDSSDIRSKLKKEIESELRRSKLDRELREPDKGRAFITKRVLASFDEFLPGPGLFGDFAISSSDRAGGITRQIESTQSFEEALQILEHSDRRLSSLSKQQIYNFLSNPKQPGLSWERLTGLKDRWSMRVNRDVRIIAETKGQGFYRLLYVGHHDEAYRWADRR